MPTFPLWFRCEASSPYIRPVGYCQETGTPLTTPPGMLKVRLISCLGKKKKLQVLSATWWRIWSSRFHSELFSLLTEQYYGWYFVTAFYFVLRLFPKSGIVIEFHFRRERTFKYWQHFLSGELEERGISDGVSGNEGVTEPTSLPAALELTKYKNGKWKRTEATGKSVLVLGLGNACSPQK